MLFLQRTGLAVLFTLAIGLYASGYMAQEGKATTLPSQLDSELTSLSVSAL